MHFLAKHMFYNVVALIKVAAIAQTRVHSGFMKFAETMTTIKR